MPQPTQDLTGQRFGRLVALERDRSRPGAARWRCQCDCGNQVSPTSACLRTGHTRSCGCLKRKTTTERNFRHGLSRTPTYNSWANMIRRTTKVNDPRYPDWGGRGITVCDRWLDFRNFLADMGVKPPGTTLDRIDNDGNYEPGNCQWTSPARQARNQRRFTLTPDKVMDIQRLYGEGLGVKQIAAQLGIRRHTVGTVCTVLDALAREP